MNVIEQFSLGGRCALVTGGTKGLGRAMAEGLAEAGAQVAIVSRHGEEADAVAFAAEPVLGGYAAVVEEEVGHR